VELAIAEAISTHSRIRFRNPDYGVNTIYGSKEIKVSGNDCRTGHLQSNLAV
jgi:hypothetical protein